VQNRWVYLVASYLLRLESISSGLTAIDKMLVFKKNKSTVKGENGTREDEF
jgi:hypothetical protein